MSVITYEWLTGVGFKKVEAKIRFPKSGSEIEWILRRPTIGEFGITIIKFIKNRGFDVFVDNWPQDDMEKYSQRTLADEGNCETLTQDRVTEFIQDNASEEPTVYRLLVQTIYDGDGWSAIALNLPGCASCGETRQSSLDNIKEAFEGLRESYIASGWKIPWKQVDLNSVPDFEEIRILNPSLKKQ